MNDNKNEEIEDQNKKMKRQLNIIKGQIEGIKKMIDEDQDCFSIVNQVKSVKSSIGNIGKSIILNRFRECILNKKMIMSEAELGTLLNAISK